MPRHRRSARGNGLQLGGRCDYARKLEARIGGSQRGEQLILQIENFEPLFTIGDLEHEAGARVVA